MAKQTKWLLITAESPMYSCEVRVPERKAITALKQIKRAHEEYKIRAGVHSGRKPYPWSPQPKLKRKRIEYSSYRGELTVSIQHL